MSLKKIVLPSLVALNAAACATPVKALNGAQAVFEAPSGVAVSFKVERLSGTAALAPECSLDLINEAWGGTYEIRFASGGDDVVVSLPPGRYKPASLYCGKAVDGTFTAQPVISVFADRISYAGRITVGIDGAKKFLKHDLSAAPSPAMVAKLAGRKGDVVSAGSGKPFPLQAPAE